METAALGYKDIPLAYQIVTFPHEKVETFFEVAIAHTPQGGRSKLWDPKSYLKS